jgi:hypothetical protein
MTELPPIRIVDPADEGSDRTIAVIEDVTHRRMGVVKEGRAIAAKIRNGLLTHPEDRHTLDLRELDLEGADVVVIEIEKWSAPEPVSDGS